jgi:hypothetical protein
MSRPGNRGAPASRDERRGQVSRKRGEKHGDPEWRAKSLITQMRSVSQAIQADQPVREQPWQPAHVNVVVSLVKHTKKKHSRSTPAQRVKHPQRSFFVWQALFSEENQEGYKA